MMPFSSPFSGGQPQSKIPQENNNHTSQFEYSNFLVSGTSDPPSALEIAFPSDVFFPNDDYPPGFPCTSGCGKKFPTVIMQEIHVQHYCKGPYDEIESCLETSVAAFDTPSIGSDDDHDWIPQLPSSPGMAQLESNPALIPALSINSGSEHGVTPQLPSSPGMGQSESNPLRIPAIFTNSGSEHGVTPQLPSSPGMGQLESNPLRIPAISTSSGSEYGVTPQLPSSPGMGHLEPNPASTPPFPINSGSEHGVTPHLPSSPGMGQLEADLLSVPAGDNSKGIHCPLCDKYLKKRQNLKAHMAIHNWPINHCPVDGCHYSTRSQGGLDLHMRVRHSAITDEREGETFSCYLCGRIMGNPERLRRHLRYHDAGKFPCPIEPCLAPVMSTPDALNQHLDTKHGHIPDV